MRRLFPATLAVGLVLLAGCSGDDEPEPRISPTDSSSVASTPTASPTPTGPVEPTLPPAAEGEDAAAAEAFVRFYWEVADHAQASGDTTRLRSLADTSCAACKAGADFVDEVYGNGGSIVGGDTTTSDAQATQIEFRNEIAFQVKARIRTTDQRVEGGAGQKDQKFPADSVRANFVVRHASTGWLVLFWETQ